MKKQLDTKTLKTVNGGTFGCGGIGIGIGVSVGVSTGKSGGGKGGCGC